MPITKNRVAIVGVGATTLSRTPDRSHQEMAIEAARKAADDAGLNPADIDAINIQTHGWPPPDWDAIIAGIGMRDVHYRYDGIGRMGVGTVRPSAEALDRGDCHAIVVIKALTTLAPILTPDIDPETGRVAGPNQFEVPYGLGYTMQRIGFRVRRWLERYAVTEEQIGWVALTEREHAIQHPNGFQKRPLTMDDYLNARMIAEPTRLLDCDIPVNGSVAYIMTGEHLARSLRHAPVYVMGFADSKPAEPLEFTEGLAPVAEEVYRDTGLGPGDMDAAYVYDGFSFWVPMWLEELGLAKRGEGAAFVEGGDRWRIDGEFPVNTHGGNLSYGRMHGQAHIIEAVEQIRGTTGTRRPKREVNYAVASTMGPGEGYVAILGKGF